ncbi:MAG: hypothetical protein KF758_17165 [Anaerolineales bacterium]|nr:hypothetical protein [Anaerolineales bacterium]MBX3038645.1 hypothetical protein [Anaerolineales bacterium]
MKEERFKSFVAVLVAVVTVLGASAACFSAVAVSSAGDMDFSGIDIAIRGQKAQIINHIDAYEDYRAFTDFLRYDELGYQYYDNEKLQKESWGVAEGIRFYFFDSRYLGSDALSFDIQRQIDGEWAEDTQQEDLNPQPYFDQSDALRVTSSSHASMMIVFAISFWFLTLAQATEKSIKYLWVSLGILFALGGIFGLAIGGLLS